MKAAVIHEFGDVNVLKFEEVETPRPKPKHILIKVLAAGVNRLEHTFREGSLVPEIPFPQILGADAAGEVAEMGQGISGTNDPFIYGFLLWTKRASVVAVIFFYSIYLARELIWWLFHPSS